MTAIGYIRQSRRADLDLALSYDSQLAAIHRLAQRDGIARDQITILADMGRSGGRGKERLRAGYQSLLETMEAGSVATVYALSLTRLARSVSELYRLLDLANERGVRLVMDKEGTLDPNSASGELQFGVFALFAQFERSLAVERANENVAVRRARGDVMGRRAYGGSPGEDPQRVIDAYRTAGSWNGAAQALNAAGLPSALGRQWRPSSVREVVKRYAPEAVPLHPARGVAPVGGFALSRLLRCSFDGRFLTGARHLQTGQVEYRCHGADGNAAHPRPRSIAERRVLPWVMAEAARFRLPFRTVEMAETRSMERGDLETKRARIIDAFIEGIIDKAERDRRLAVVSDALGALDEQSVLVTLEPIEWTEPPKTVNGVLRALWSEVTLDATMRPVAAEWRHPEWHSPA